MNLHKDKKFINLVKNQRFAVIATNDKDEPYTNLVSFMISEAVSYTHLRAHET